MRSVSLEASFVACEIERLGRVTGMLETCREFSTPQVAKVIEEALHEVEQASSGLIGSFVEEER